MLLLQTGIPDNTSYLILGLALLVAIYGGWLVSYIVRLRNVKRDLTMLEDLSKE